jgi:glycine/serine hydroxymethyltransferase
LRHWYDIISDTQTARKNFEKQFKQFAQKVKHNAEILKENLKQEGLYSPIYEDICSVINKRCDIV